MDLITCLLVNRMKMATEMVTGSTDGLQNCEGYSGADYVIVQVILTLQCKGIGQKSYGF